MKKEVLTFLYILLTFATLTAQSIEKKWILKDKTTEITSTLESQYFLELQKGNFSYTLDSLGQLSGSYIQQNSILLLFLSLIHI